MKERLRHGRWEFLSPVVGLKTVACIIYEFSLKKG
jgi:hypothetical protein